MQTTFQPPMTSVPRRPPAIAPDNLTLDGEIQLGIVESPDQDAANILRMPLESSFVVLRLPDVSVGLPETSQPLKHSSDSKSHATVMGIATAIVLLAAMLFGGRGKEPDKPSDPSNDAPPWQSSGTPAHQPLPVWKEPVVVLPPIPSSVPQPSTGSQGDGPRLTPDAGAGVYPSTYLPAQPMNTERYPEYRTADRSGGFTDRVQREQIDLARPNVRFEGTIEKNSTGTTYDGPRSSPN